MTPVILLEEIKKFIEAELKDLILPVRVEKNGTEPKARTPEVHIMRLKNKTDKTQKIPYILLQFLKSEDGQPEGQNVQSESWVRIVVAAYSEDEYDGVLCVLNILTRLRLAFLRAGIIGKQFLLRPPLETIVYPEQTPPYYFGEAMTVWRTPGIESECELWQ